ncbi:hypothetical protein EC843_101726 [Buttiauxella sp. JUb87]|nr:hypothetical protein EC843_101726 [Buttiauxella sp. JUb87]
MSAVRSQQTCPKLLFAHHRMVLINSDASFLTCPTSRKTAGQINVSAGTVLLEIISSACLPLTICLIHFLMREPEGGGREYQPALYEMLTSPSKIPLTHRLVLQTECCRSLPWRSADHQHGGLNRAVSCRLPSSFFLIPFITHRTGSNYE